MLRTSQTYLRPWVETTINCSCLPCLPSSIKISTGTGKCACGRGRSQQDPLQFSSIPGPKRSPEDLLQPHPEPAESNFGGHQSADTMELLSRLVGPAQGAPGPLCPWQAPPFNLRVVPFMPLPSILFGNCLGAVGSGEVGRCSDALPSLLDMEGAPG